VENGHAWTAVGYYGDRTKKAPAAAGDDHLHVAAWIDGLIVHNDQTGPYVNLPRVAPSQAGETQGVPPFGKYTCADIFGLIVPLPDKVFLRADRAEEYAWMFVTEKHEEWWRKFTPPTGWTVPGENAPKPLNRESLVARTFLTRGYNHYQWLANVSAHSEILNLAAALHHPRYVWITEFYALKEGVPDFDHAVAHVMADATATSETSRTAPYNAFMFSHVPGRGFAVLTSGRPAGAKFAVVEVPHDHPYRAFDLRKPSAKRK
jgi:hypothetical protein